MPEEQTLEQVIEEAPGCGLLTGFISRVRQRYLRPVQRFAARVQEYIEDKAVAVKEAPKLTAEYIDDLYSRIGKDQKSLIEVAKNQYGTIDGNLAEEGVQRVNERLEARYFGAIRRLREKFEIYNYMFEQGTAEKLDFPEAAIKRLNILVEMHKSKYPDIVLGVV